MSDTVAAVQAILPVSRETVGRLETYVALIRKWQPAENLISPKTLPEIWRRHVADSAQLVPLFPATRRWLDLGTGAGFPGMVVALLAAPGGHVHLIESNTRKCAFLRTVIRETGAAATVHEGRAEAILETWDQPVDRVIARALAPLSRLFDLAAPLMVGGVTGGIPAAFHKGDDFRREIADASQSWNFDLVEHASRVGEGGVILEITRLGHTPRQAHTSASQSP